MKRIGEIMRLWMAAVVLLIFGACSSDSSEEQPPVLNIYVYAPGQPTPTRSLVEPTEEEKKVHSMTIWVFKSSDGSQLGSISLNQKDNEKELESLNNDNMGIYSMRVSEDFARNPEPVDVYVLANVSASNTGTTFDVTKANKVSLENAQFDGGYYYKFVRTDTSVTKLSGEGLPMSGVVREKAVINQNAVLHMTNANLQLARDISKIRFVFSAIKDSYFYIDGVLLNKNLLYTSDYLFLNDENPYFRVGTTGLWDKDVVLVGRLKDNNGAPQYVKMNEDPREYAYVSGMDESIYEAKIDEGLAAEKLTEAPTVYLPESDKRLMGTIYYHLNNDATQRTATFTMLNGDFRRNQTWIVYIYYNGSSKLDITSVKVTDWADGGQADHSLHNW